MRLAGQYLWVRTGLRVSWTGGWLELTSAGSNSNCIVHLSAEQVILYVLSSW